MSVFSRRAIVAGIAVSALSPTLRTSAQTGLSYPDRPIRMIVPYPPGGGSDFVARLLAQRMSEGLGQSMIVDNKPGAGTTIGNDVVAKAPADGYTLLQVNRDMGICPSTFATLPYDTLNSFAWIGNAADAPFVLVVNPTIPAMSLIELAALAKAKPGFLTYGCLVGGIAHLNVEALKHYLGIDLLHVPYKGAGPSLAATVSGEIAVTLASLPGAIPFIREGRLRALGVGAATRSSSLPEVPTIEEAGGGNGTVLPSFCGLAAPAGTPRPIIDKLSIELKRVMALPEVAERIVQNGFVPSYSTPESLFAQMVTDIEHFGKLVRLVGLSPQ